MGYIKVTHREILRQIDNYSSLPKGWDKFVDKQAQYHNLVIKSKKNQCYFRRLIKRIGILFLYQFFF